MDSLFSNLMSICALDSKVPDSCANKIRGNSGIFVKYSQDQPNERYTTAFKYFLSFDQ
jgi:hypothetical protein